jgi:hypothetical protein
MALHLPMAIVAIHLSASPEIPPKTLHLAQERAAQILASAHVKPVWLDHADLQLYIVATEPRGPATDATGFAVLIPGANGYAAVCWPAVLREATQMEVDPALLLGAAMAHELGHLLFGRWHTHSGVMSPRLGPKEMELAARGELRFEGRTQQLLTSGRNPLFSR